MAYEEHLPENPMSAAEFESMIYSNREQLSQPIYDWESAGDFRTERQADIKDALGEMGDVGADAIYEFRKEFVQLRLRKRAYQNFAASNLLLEYAVYLRTEADILMEAVEEAPEIFEIFAANKYIEGEF